MKRAKQLFSLFVFLLLVSSISAVAGFPVPMVVYGTVNIEGENYAGQIVTIKSNNLDYEWSIKTNENGMYQFDLNNLRDSTGGSIGSNEVLEIRACSASLDSRCKKEFTASTDPQVIGFIIGKDSASDGSHAVSDKDKDNDGGGSGGSDCNPIIISCSDQYQCPTCTTCETCEEVKDCEEDGYGLEAIIGAIALLVGGGIGGIFIKRNEALSKGVGVKLYTQRDGGHAVLHKHPGIKGYHEPVIRHRSVGDRHPKGELTPAYVKNEKGVWTYTK